MSYFDMSETQFAFLRDMLLANSDTQVLLKPRSDDTPERFKNFTQLNDDADALVAHGFCEELQELPPKPPGYPYDFRMVRITAQGRALFTDEKGTSVRAV